MVSSMSSLLAKPSINICLLLVITITLAACSNRKRQNYEAIGQNLCSCSEDLKSKNERFKQLLEKKQTEKIMSLMDTLNMAENNLKACILQENKDKNFLADQNSGESLHKVLGKLCPDRAAKIVEITNELK